MEIATFINSILQNVYQNRSLLYKAKKYNICHILLSVISRPRQSHNSAYKLGSYHQVIHQDSWQVAKASAKILKFYFCVDPFPTKILQFV